MRKRMFVVSSTAPDNQFYIVKARSLQGAEWFVAAAVYAGLDQEGKRKWSSLDDFHEAFEFTAHKPVAVLDAKEKA